MKLRVIAKARWVNFCWVLAFSKLLVNHRLQLKSIIYWEWYCENLLRWYCFTFRICWWVIAISFFTRQKELILFTIYDNICLIQKCTSINSPWNLSSASFLVFFIVNYFYVRFCHVYNSKGKSKISINMTIKCSSMF